MEVICFIEHCGKEFESSNEYVNHLKNLHHIPESYRFVCTYESCPSIFGRMYAFKRHICSHLLDKDSMSENDFNVVAKLPKSVNFEETQSFLNIVEMPSTSNQKPKNALEETLRDIDRSSVNFTLRLHQQNNITRIDVRNIQKATENVYAKIADGIANVSLKFISSESKYEFDM